MHTFGRWGTRAEREFDAFAGQVRRVDEGGR